MNKNERDYFMGNYEAKYARSKAAYNTAKRKSEAMKRKADNFVLLLIIFEAILVMFVRFCEGSYGSSTLQLTFLCLAITLVSIAAMSAFVVRRQKIMYNAKKRVRYFENKLENLR